MRFGIIGTNFISDEFVKAGQTVKDFEALAVCSRNANRGKAFAEKYGIQTVVTSLENLLELPSLEAVYIATPNACHYVQAKAALLAGKHVLVEKPAVPSLAEFEELSSLAQARGLAFMEGMRTVHTEGFRAIAKGLPTLGPVRKASISYCQYSRRYDHFKQGIVENAFDPMLCNGALMDIGTYCIATMTALFGRPKEILAYTWKLDNGLDAMDSVLCNYDGFIADLSFGKVSDTRRPSEIQGEQGTILYYPPTNPNSVKLISRVGEESMLYEDKATDFFGMHNEIEDFLKFSQNPEALKAYTQYSADTLFVMDEIRRQLNIDFQKH